MFDVGGLAIATGYRPFGTICPAYDVYRKYDDAAQKIIYDYSMTGSAQREAIDKLLHEFIEEVTA